MGENSQVGSKVLNAPCKIVIRYIDMTVTLMQTCQRILINEEYIQETHTPPTVNTRISPTLFFRSS